MESPAPQPEFTPMIPCVAQIRPVAKHLPSNPEFLPGTWKTVPCTKHGVTPLWKHPRECPLLGCSRPKFPGDPPHTPGEERDEIQRTTFGRRVHLSWVQENGEDGLNLQIVTSETEIENTKEDATTHSRAVRGDVIPRQVASGNSTPHPCKADKDRASDVFLRRGRHGLLETSSGNPMPLGTPPRGLL